MGAAPTLEISSNCKNDLGVIKETAVETMTEDLDISVRKNELTENRKAELL